MALLTSWIHWDTHGLVGYSYQDVEILALNQGQGRLGSCIDLGQSEGHTEQLMLRWGSPTSVLSGTGRGSRTRLQRCTCSRVVGGLSDSGINVTAAGEIWGPWGYYWAH